MPDFETFLLALASIALIIVAFGFSWAVISGLWWLIRKLIGWQFSFRRGHRNLDCGYASEMGDKP